MIGLVRYGFIGYSEANVALSLGLLSAATLILFAINHRLFTIGYRLRA
jgi:ABC-2 type transport system permease protein